MTTKLFGEPVRRREDARLIIGQGRYLDDIGSGALAAAFVRSPHAHARITDIDVEGALDVEGLVAIYTYDDLHGPMAEPLPVLIPHPQLYAPRTGYPLANGMVNHVGEPIAMVVATDRYIAEDACDRILVAYEELPVVVGVDADDPGVRVRAAHERGGQGGGAADVVEVAALADDQPGVLAPADRLAEQLGGHPWSRMASAAWCTAFLMLA